MFPSCQLNQCWTRVYGSGNSRTRDDFGKTDNADSLIENRENSRDFPRVMVSGKYLRDVPVPGQWSRDLEVITISRRFDTPNIAVSVLSFFLPSSPVFAANDTIPLGLFHLNFRSGYRRESDDWPWCAPGARFVTADENRARRDWANVVNHRYGNVEKYCQIPIIFTRHSARLELSPWVGFHTHTVLGLMRE